jgi:hypothetical protein
MGDISNIFEIFGYIGLNIDIKQRTARHAQNAVE